MQKYFEIPLVGNTDLSQTSYRAMHTTESALYIEYNEGAISGDWNEVTLAEIIAFFGFNPFEAQQEPEAQPLTEAEQMQIETYLNTAFIADMMALSM